jgi:hypothetical protein
MCLQNIDAVLCGLCSSVVDSLREIGVLSMLAPKMSQNHLLKQNLQRILSFSKELGSRFRNDRSAGK